MTGCKLPKVAYRPCSAFLLEDDTLDAPLSIDALELEGTHINPRSFLATDYLNHFNEVIMLIEMTPDMPDCLADVLDWHPISYTEHFAKSGFKDAELTIKAYHAAPKPVRHRFDSLVADITVSLIEIIKEVERHVDGGDFNSLRLLVSSQVRELRGMIDEASAIINGCKRHQPVDDEFMAAPGANDAKQVNIDAIFDAAC